MPAVKPPFPVRRGVPINRALAAAWLMPKANQGSNRLDDYSGRGNHGTLAGGVAWTAGRAGPALSFDGSTGYIALADSPSLDITGPITILTWIRTTSAAAFSDILNGYDLSSPYDGYGFGLNLDGLSPGKVFYWSGAHGAWVGGNTAVNDGKWHRIGVAVAGTTASFFVDGRPDGTQTSAQPNSYAGPRLIGSSGAGQPYFSGLLDDLRVAATAWTANDFRVDYRAAYDEFRAPTASESRAFAGAPSAIPCGWIAGPHRSPQLRPPIEMVPY